MKEVHFLGFQEIHTPILKESDIFISTSISEGFSLVICEALVLGIPIVATNTAGALELLEGGEYGVITEQNDLSIYVALKKYITDETLRTEYHKKSLLRANIFEVQSVMSRFMKLFNEKSCRIWYYFKSLDNSRMTFLIRFCVRWRF